MIENKEKFAQIEGLFWGDIEQENRRFHGLNKLILVRCRCHA